MKASAAIGLPLRLVSWGVAGLLCGWRFRHRRAHSAAHTNPIVFVALDTTSADRFHEMLTASLQRKGAAGLRVERVSSSGNLQRVLAGSAASQIIVADLDRWVWELENCQVLYLRPHLLILKEILPGVSRMPPPANGAVYLDRLDHLLSRFPAISLEALFHQPERIAEALNRTYGVALFEADDFTPAREGAYRDALSEILSMVENRSFADDSAMLSFPVGGTYATTLHRPGALALSEGWSSPEAEWTWSDGPRASLAIRLAATRASRLHLQLDGMLAPGERAVRVFVGEQLEAEIWKGEAPHREYSIELSVPTPSSPDCVLSVALEFSKTFCPKDAGFGPDNRRLGFALRSFTITDEGRLTASLRSLIRWRNPRSTVVFGRQMAPSHSKPVSILAESGLSGLLVTLTEPAPDGARLGQHRDSPPLRDPAGAAGSPSSEFFSVAAAEREAYTAAGSSASAGDLREIGFRGTLLQLFAELDRQGSPVDLIIVSAGYLFGGVLDSLEAVLAADAKPFPDIAICTDDPGFLDRWFFQDPERYRRVVHKFTLAAVDPGLIALIGQARAGSIA